MSRTVLCVCERDAQKEQDISHHLGKEVIEDRIETFMLHTFCTSARFHPHHTKARYITPTINQAKTCFPHMIRLRGRWSRRRPLSNRAVIPRHLSMELFGCTVDIRGECGRPPKGGEKPSIEKLLGASMMLKVAQTRLLAAVTIM